MLKDELGICLQNKKEEYFMSSNPKCPQCGFVSHPVSSDGKTVTYVCERCGCVFKEKK